jgi:DNA-binding transcriptional ArsR family regulator
MPIVPERELVQGVYTLRDMRLPHDTKLTRQSLLRWFCLSVGLLSEDETRQSVIPVIDALLEFQLKEKRDPTVKELAERSKEPEKAVRYHVGRMRDIGLVEDDGRKYRVRRDAFSNKLDLVKSFREHVEPRVTKSFATIEDALAELQRQYS